MSLWFKPDVFKLKKGIPAIIVKYPIFLQTYSKLTQFSVGGGPIFHIGMGERYLILEYQDLEYVRGILTRSLNDLLKKDGGTVLLLLEKE
jgi:hypothetical protein